MIARLFKSSGKSGSGWSPAGLPANRRAYAVGDIHGRLDLFDALMDRIETDNAARPAAQVDLILLGDYVDRGADSAGLIDRLIAYRPGFATLHRLLGNHEDYLLSAYEGSLEALRPWLRYGGWETLRSYGIEESVIERRDMSVIAAMRNAIPAAHIDWIRSLELSRRIGDYLFVHAGIAPGVPLADQTAHDLLWIREKFLNDDRDFGVVVVHGHTPARAVELRRNRIGVDTMAYDTGCLSAVGLEGTEHWLVQTGEPAPADRAAGHICSLRHRAE